MLSWRLCYYQLRQLKLHAMQGYKPATKLIPHIGSQEGKPSFLRSGLASLMVLLFVAGAMVVGGGSELFTWAIQGLLTHPLRHLALIALYLLPGLALLRLFFPRGTSWPSAVWLSLAVGGSISLPPILYYGFHLLHLPWNGYTSWGYLLLSATVALAPIRFTPHPRLARPIVARPWYFDATEGRGSGTMLVALTGVALVVRLFAVRDLPTGMFGDSYHHTIITRLLVDHEGLFSSWEPYAPLATFTYHFGFHAHAAVVHWISGIDIIRSVIITGQLLNACSLPMAFVLAFALVSKFSHEGTVPRSVSLHVGLWAALLTGFISTLPAYYVNWGRYTQLTGHLVLSMVVVCWILLTRTSPPQQHHATETRPNPPNPWHERWGPYILTTVATSAMILTHYLVTIFAVAFVGIYVLVLVLVRRSWKLVGVIAVRTTLVSLLVAVICGPWILRVFDGYLVINAIGLKYEGLRSQRVIAVSTLPAIAPLYARRPIVMGAIIGLIVAGWQRQWEMGIAGLWTIILTVSVVPHLLGLPGTGVIDSLTGLGAWYLTLPILTGYALTMAQRGGQWICSHLHLPTVVGPVGVGGVFLIGVAWGCHWQKTLIDPSTQLVTHADMQAMHWIRNHTPPTSRFYVNSFPSYGGTLVAGTDAGWWLPFLTGRASNLPPLTYGSEQGHDPFYLAHVNRLVETIRGKPLTDSTPVRVDLTTPTARKTLRDAGITHVYIGAHASPDPATADSIDTTKLHQDPAFRLIYHHEGVEIFQIHAPVDDD